MNDYPEIRASLVKFTRGVDRPMTLKAHAEVLITTIDEIAKDPTNPAPREAFVQAYRRFQRAADGGALPAELAPAEIARRLGLGVRDLQ